MYSVCVEDEVPQLYSVLYRVKVVLLNEKKW